jgi:sugar-specific transcriptional regulator TrmB
MKKMDLIQSLKNLGLNEKEAKVYITLLQIPKATAYSVAKRSGLKRPTTYVVLEDLIDKGIVNKVPRAKTMQYTAISPEDLFAIMSSRLENAHAALPELKALNQSKDYKVRATYYEGMDGLKEMYKKMIKTMEGKEIISFAGHGREASDDLIKYWSEFNKERVKKNVRVKTITPDDPSNKDYLENPNQYLLNIKSVPVEKYDSNISIDVYKNFVEIISFKHLQGMLIENPDVAKAIKQIFEMLWEKIDHEARNT